MIVSAEEINKSNMGKIETMTFSIKTLMIFITLCGCYFCFLTGTTGVIKERFHYDLMLLRSSDEKALC